MGGVNFGRISSRAVGIGENEFEGGVITVEAGQTIKAGTVLIRNSNTLKFEKAKGNGSDTLIAVMPFDLTNESNADADMGFRALISGKARKDMLCINGNAITKNQADSLRDYGIIAVEVTDMSRVNP